MSLMTAAEFRQHTRPTEKQVQRAVIQLYRSVGCAVANFSQARASKQTAGIPDCYVFPPRRLRPFWHEVKRPGGKLSEAQAVWRSRCQHAGVGYVFGGVDAAIAYLRALGLIA